MQKRVTLSTPSWRPPPPPPPPPSERASSKSNQKKRRKYIFLFILLLFKKHNICFNIHLSSLYLSFLSKFFLCVWYGYSSFDISQKRSYNRRLHVNWLSRSSCGLKVHWSLWILVNICQEIRLWIRFTKPVTITVVAFQLVNVLCILTWSLCLFLYYLIQKTPERNWKWLRRWYH